MERGAPPTQSSGSLDRLGLRKATRGHCAFGRVIVTREIGAPCDPDAHAPPLRGTLTIPHASRAHDQPVALFTSRRTVGMRFRCAKSRDYSNRCDATHFQRRRCSPRCVDTHSLAVSHHQRSSNQKRGQRVYLSSRPTARDAQCGPLSVRDLRLAPVPEEP